MIEIFADDHNPGNLSCRLVAPDCYCFSCSFKIKKLILIRLLLLLLLLLLLRLLLHHHHHPLLAFILVLSTAFSCLFVGSGCNNNNQPVWLHASLANQEARPPEEAICLIDITVIMALVVFVVVFVVVVVVVVVVMMMWWFISISKKGGSHKLICGAQFLYIKLVCSCWERKRETLTKQTGRQSWKRNLFHLGENCSVAEWERERKEGERDARQRRIGSWTI